MNEALFDIRTRWFSLGLQLGIHPGTLNTIEHQYQRDPDKCLLKLLIEWLKSGEASWEKLISALTNKTLGETNIAGKLEEKHCSASSECFFFYTYVLNSKVWIIKL